MMVFKKISLLFGCICSLNSAFAGDEIKFTPDGRMGTSCMLARTGAKTEQCHVTTAQLVITPERYHKKRVMVKGTLVSKFEMVGLIDGSHKVWLKFPENKSQYGALHGKQVLIEGTYDGLSFGHFHQWGGTVENITRVESLN